MPYKNQNSQVPLTAREIEVLGLIAIGLSNAQIAKELRISEKTLDIFTTSIRLKIGIHSRVLLAFYALGKGYVSQESIKNAIAKERKKLNHG